MGFGDTGFFIHHKNVMADVQGRLSAGCGVLPMSPVAEVGRVEMARHMPQSIEFRGLRAPAVELSTATTASRRATPTVRRDKAARASFLLPTNCVRAGHWFASCGDGSPGDAAAAGLADERPLSRPAVSRVLACARARSRHRDGDSPTWR